jgi:hypothetical protein
MYRDSQHSFAQTIERLEQELAELRALHAPPRPRERTLWAVTALCIVAGTLAVVSCALSHERAVLLQQRFDAVAARLESKTTVLAECQSLADQEQAAQMQRRIDAWQAMATTRQGQAPKN